MSEKDPLLTLKDFEGILDIGKMIIIPPKVEIRISYVFNEIPDMAKGGVLMKEETSLFFKEEECFLIPAGQFGKILAHAKVTLEEKGDVNDKPGESKPGDPSIN